MPLGTTLLIVIVAVTLMAVIGGALGFGIALGPTLLLSVVLTLLVSGAMTLYYRHR